MESDILDIDCDAGKNQGKNRDDGRSDERGARLFTVNANEAPPYLRLIFIINWAAVQNSAFSRNSRLNRYQ